MNSNLQELANKHAVIAIKSVKYLAEHLTAQDLIDNKEIAADLNKIREGLNVLFKEIAPNVPAC